MISVCAPKASAMPATPALATIGVMLMPSHFSYPKTGIGRWPWVVAVPVALAVLARHAFS